MIVCLPYDHANKDIDKPNIIRNMDKLKEKSAVTKRKDRVATEKRLICSVGEIMETEGPSGLTINKIWRHSGIAKTSIYRYFKNVNGLIIAYYKSEDIRLREIDFDISLSSKEDVIEAIMTSVEKTYHFIAHKKAIRKFMLWELSERQKILIKILKQREAVHVSFLKKIEPLLVGCSIDFKAVYALIYAAINCLVLEVKAYPGTHFGYHISNTKERERLFTAIRSLLTTALN
jgi:AcrR family transcriptional regulator